MKNFWNSLALSAALVLAVEVHAASARTEEAPPRGPIPFYAFDRNEDGVITQDEFDAVRAERMQKRAAEGRPMRGAGGAPAFADFDLDGDGSISKAEFIEFRNKRISERVEQGYQMKGLSEASTFEELDLDGDGKLSREEFDAHLAQRRQSGQPLQP